MIAKIDSDLLSCIEDGLVDFKHICLGIDSFHEFSDWDKGVICPKF